MPTPAPTPASRPHRRRWRWILGGVGGLLILLGALAIWGAPRLAPWLLRSRILPALERRTHRQVTVGSLHARWGTLDLRNVQVRGVKDCPGAPLLRVDRVRLAYDPWALLRGRITVTALSLEGPKVCLRRLRDGSDNARDLFRRAGASKASGRLRLSARAIGLRRGTLVALDELGGLRLEASELSGRIAPRGRSELQLDDAKLERIPTSCVRHLTDAPCGDAPKGWLRAPLRAARVTVTVTRTSAHRLADPVVHISGGRLLLHDHLVLTDISGRVRLVPGRRLRLDLRGSYGGATHPLWEAAGTVELPAAGERRPPRGSIHLRAQRFTLDKLGPALPGRLVANPEQAALAMDVSGTLAPGRITFHGSLSLAGLTVIHPYLARRPIEDIGFAGQIRGSYRFDRDLLRIQRAELSRRGVTMRLSGDVYRLRGEPRFTVDLSVDRVGCGRMLRAAPVGLLPELQRMRLAGWFSLRLHAEADFKYLTTSSVTLTGAVDRSHCRVISLPWEISASRLSGPFGYEFVDAGHHLGFEVGPDNPDFVPLDQVSPYVVRAVLTTEDSRFFYHHGFIPREFQSALARNLIARRFVFGASSITMQMVKNVLLGRRKTLARKLQELVLTWYLERHLSKERILEIYLNIIELGPGIYGIGRAAWHFFGKDASALEPQEAAYLASILPSPKRRYRAFCRQRVSRRWRAWVDRILRIMHKRHRLTDEELARALATPIAFSDREWGSRAACLARLHRFRAHRSR